MEVKATGEDRVRGLGIGEESLVVEEAAEGAVGVGGLGDQGAGLRVGVKLGMEESGPWEKIKVRCPCI